MISVSAPRLSIETNHFESKTSLQILLSLLTPFFELLGTHFESKTLAITRNCSKLQIFTCLLFSSSLHSFLSFLHLHLQLFILAFLPFRSIQLQFRSISINNHQITTKTYKEHTTWVQTSIYAINLINTPKDSILSYKTMQNKVKQTCKKCTKLMSSNLPILELACPQAITQSSKLSQPSK